VGVTIESYGKLEILYINVDKTLFGRLNEVKYIDLIEKMKNLMRNESVQNVQ
jgi:hypothetical protein